MAVGVSEHSAERPPTWRHQYSGDLLYCVPRTVRGTLNVGALQQLMQHSGSTKFEDHGQDDVDTHMERTDHVPQTLGQHYS